MKEKFYEDLDDLFVQIRVRLGIVRQSDPATAEEIKGLVRQLEDCVESLVIDSLRLKSLKGGSERATKLEKRQRAKK